MNRPVKDHNSHIMEAVVALGSVAVIGLIMVVSLTSLTRRQGDAAGNAKKDTVMAELAAAAEAMARALAAEGVEAADE